MKNIIILAVLLATTLSSCITSLHPLVTADKVVKDNRVEGTWITDGDTVVIERFTNSQPYRVLQKFSPFAKMVKEKNSSLAIEDSIMYANGYSISFRKNGVEYFMFGAMIRIDNNLFFDLLPVIADDPKNKDEEGYEYTNDYLPSFTMAKLEIANKNTLALHFVNGDFIKAMIRQGNMRLKHEQNSLFETFMVTASSKELQQFLNKYGHDERLFNKENSVTLTRKG